MATKTGLTSAIGSAISIVVSRAKLLLGLDEIINELYPTAVTDNNTTETYTTKAGTNITYSITLFKQGNLPAIKGTITNSLNKCEL